MLSKDRPRPQRHNMKGPPMERITVTSLALLILAAASMFDPHVWATSGEPKPLSSSQTISQWTDPNGSLHIRGVMVPAPPPVYRVGSDYCCDWPDGHRYTWDGVCWCRCEGGYCYRVRPGQTFPPLTPTIAYGHGTRAQNCACGSSCACGQAQSSCGSGSCSSYGSWRPLGWFRPFGGFFRLRG